MSGNNIIQPLSDAIASVQEAIQILSGGGVSDRATYDFGPSSLSDRILSPDLFKGDIPLSPAYSIDTADGYDWASIGNENAVNVYSDEYMDKFVGLQVKGADNPKLNSLMTDLLTIQDLDSPQALDLVKDIAAIRGIPEDQFIEQFERYKTILDEKVDGDGSQHYAPDDYSKGDFMGSLSHLRYGTVVGDVIGLDPVFAGMLNPTGGVVGPGQFGQVADPDSSLSYHGIFHDAGGYLHNWLELGPGYDYLTFDTKLESPLDGQLPGIQYWNEKLGVGTLDSVGDVAEWTAHFIGDGASYGLHEGGILIDDASDAIGGWTNEALDDFGGFVGFIPGAEDFFDGAGDHFEDQFDQAGDLIEDVGAGLGEGAEWVFDTAGDGVDMVFDGAESAIDEISDFTSDAWDAFSSF